MSERFVTVLPTTKNCGLRANDQMAKMGCRQENFEECESGCAYHGIIDFVTNTLLYLRTVFTTHEDEVSITNDKIVEERA